MSVTIMSAVWPLDLPATDKMVLLALADAANDEGVTWIAVRSRKEGKLDILTKCSLSERAVQGAISRLVQAGHLKRDEKPGKGVIYTVQPQTPAADAPRTNCAPQETTQTPAADAGKPLVTVIPSEPKGSSGVKRVARRIPDDWFPEKPLTADVAELVAQWPPGRLERELAGFRDYWIARQRDAARTDWDRTWWNRIRDQHDKIMRENRNVRPANDPQDFSPTVRAVRTSLGRSDDRGHHAPGGF